MPYGGYIGANDIWVKGFEISDDTMDLIRNQDGSIRDGVEVTCNSTTMKGEYKNILDGNVDTWWFANVLPNSAPTYFIVDLGRMAKIETIEYLPSNSWKTARKMRSPNMSF